MKHLLLTTIAAVILVGCGEVEEFSTYPELPELSDMRTNSMAPIHIAADKGDLKTVKKLLDAGVDIDSQHYSGTPLHFASIAGQKKTVELLIAEGADINAITSGVAGYPRDNASSGDGRLYGGINHRLTPLDLAEISKHKEIADLLRKHGGKTGKELKAEGK